MARFGLVGSVAIAALLSGCAQGDGQSPLASVANTVTAAAHSLGSFSLSPDVTPSVGCQSRSTRWPWGQNEARIWTPRLPSAPAVPQAVAGSAYGAPFTARLVEAFGYDYGESYRSVVLEMEDGCRRAFAAKSFSDADLAAIEAGAAQHPVVPDPATYRIKFSDPDPDGKPLTSPALLESGDLHVYETQHFAFWYGNGTTDDYDFPKTIAQQGRSMEEVLRDTGEWFERIWLMNRDVLGAPMPFAKSDDKQKINIYLCGTGRPNSNGTDKDSCGASAGKEMGISAWALAKGSKVFAHEFGHVIQAWSGGFSQSFEIWETGAEWSLYTVSPGSAALAWYLNNLESGPFFSVSRYGAFPFISYLFENDRTRSLVFDVWKPAAKPQNGWSEVPRDYAEAIIARGKQTGAYPQGFASFADDAGWYGARLVAMDFVNRAHLIDNYRPTATTSSIGHFYTPLVATSGDNGTTYAPPVERELLQWGTHLIPLTAVAGQKVTVTLTGGTKANAAAWRFVIVAVGADNTPVYSALGKASGTGSGSAALTIPAGTRAYLAVTATPYRYESLGWQDLGKPIKGTRFPYSIKVEGAVPRTGPVKACDAEAQPGTWAPNYTLNGNNDTWLQC